MDERDNGRWLSRWCCVIVNWNLPFDTAACIDSLAAAGMPLCNIVVIDNGSRDQSAPILHHRYAGRIQVIELDSNLGFAGGTNIGIRHALQTGAEWILLLNNDTVVDDALFTELHRAQLARPEWAILAPLITVYDHPERIWSMGDRRIPGTLISRPPAARQTDSLRLGTLCRRGFSHRLCVVGTSFGLCRDRTL